MTTAVTFCKNGTRLVKVNGVTLEMVNLPNLGCKIHEPLLRVGKEHFNIADIGVHVCGCGDVS